MRRKNFHHDFVVHNKKAQIKCPYCGSKSTARILYGLPAFSEELQRKLDSGKISLGGCKTFEIPVDGEMVRTNPARVCNDCKKEFGRPPLVIAKDWYSAEDYRDIVTVLKFAVDSTYQERTEIMITKNETGALVKVIKSPDSENPPVTKQITVGKWKKLLDTLYSRMYLHEWKRNYGKSDVVDGTQWRLHVKLTGNRRRNYSGSNDYPPYWKELVRVFGEYTR